MTTRVATPRTPEEWQEAVDIAHVLLLVHSARCYGFITGGPTIDVDRCDKLLKQGRRRGVEPADDAVLRLLPELMGSEG